MNRATLSLVLLILIFGVVPYAADAATPEELKKYADLVRKLGDDSYQTREEAQDELMRLGLPVKAAVEEGLKSDDPEVRRRCEELIPALAQADLQRRLDGFLADKDGKKDHDLPGWKRFIEVAGKDAEARKLFADLIKVDPQFICEVEADGDKAGAMIGARATAMQQSLYGQRGIGVQPTLPEIAALLFAGSHPKVKVPQQPSYAITNLLQQTASREAINGNNPGYRKLLVHWMKAQTDANIMQNLMYMCQNLNLKEGIDMALKVASEKSAPAYTKGTALTVVGKLGSKEHIPVLEGLMADETLLGNFSLGVNVKGQTQVRDVALAMAVKFTDQSHKDYGFAFAGTPNANAYINNANCLGFNTPEQRDAAFKKWKEWSAANAKKVTKDEKK